MALEKFGALWKGKPGSKAVLSGKLEDGRRILVFTNEDKKTDRHPDYRLVVDTGDVAKPLPPLPDPFRPDAPTLSGNDLPHDPDDDVAF